MSSSANKNNTVEESNIKKLVVDTTSDSGFFSGEQQLDSGLIEADSSSSANDNNSSSKVDSTDMTRASGNSPPSKDSENYTDSGIVSCSNISTSESLPQMIVVPPYVPEYLLRLKGSNQRSRPQHPTLNIEKYFEQDEDGYTKLHIAILHNIEPAINVLINFAEPEHLNIRNFSGQTALHLTVLLGMHTTVRKLIDAGADINIRDNRCNTPLHLAVLNNDTRCVQTIISAIHPPVYGSEVSPIANLEQWNYDGESCFYVACKLRSISIMELLVKVGANVNTREGRSGYSPLHFAVETHANEVVKFLCEDCESIVNLDAENYGGFTAFQLGLLTSQDSVADYLVKKGATPYFTPESEYEDDDDDDDDLDDSISSDFEKNQLVNKIAEIAVN
jgi:ankyrin repeat protein